MWLFEKIFNNKPQTIIVKQEIDYDKLTEAIIKAQKAIKDDENEKIKEQEKQERENWRKAIGYKEYNDDKAKFYLKALHRIRNFFSVLFHFIFFSEKKATSDTVTFGLIQMTTSGIFQLCSMLLVLISFLFVLMSFGIVQEMKFIFKFQPIYLGYALPTFMFSKFFKIASFEVAKLKDKNYLIAIFSATTCFFAMVFALIALFKG